MNDDQKFIFIFVSSTITLLIILSLSIGIPTCISNKFNNDKEIKLKELELQIENKIIRK